MIDNADYFRICPQSTKIDGRSYSVMALFVRPAIEYLKYCRGIYWGNTEWWVEGSVIRNFDLVFVNTKYKWLKLVNGGFDVLLISWIFQMIKRIKVGIYTE